MYNGQMERKNYNKIGSVQKKIILLLGAGLALGLTHSGKRQIKILKELGKEWQKINRQTLERSIRLLYQSQLIEERNNPDGTTTFVLNKEGKKHALQYNLDKIKIKKPTHWDKKWRIVIFDVPVRLKKVRDSLRYHLKELGFHELQYSVFVHPFPCLGEIEFITEFYNARKFIRFIEADFIDNELHLKHKFNLL